MNDNKWVKEIDASITVCDKEGIILEMNNKSVKTFEADGGKNLIGSNLFDCHPGDSNTKLKELMDVKKVNVYTIEKNGKKKMIYQSPWFENGEYKGFVEIALEIPGSMPHFIRQ